VLSGSRIQQTTLSGGIYMRSLITLALVLVSTSAFAGSIVASQKTCSELQSIVNAANGVSISAPLGMYQVYGKSSQCFDQGYFSSKYVTLETADDDSCLVGFECTVQNGGL